MKAIIVLIVAMAWLPVTSSWGAEQGRQSVLSPARAEAAKKYPRIVLFSVAWCPHCRETKEYLTRNNIPFINRDVEVDAAAMEELTGKYGSTGVPVLVFGSGKNEAVLKGFTPELFQETLKKSQTAR
ncbi:MAG TPA: NrdH-redoxin [Desulfuromonadales bacterium]|nr:NrdH-redoxin [Desulfuromonadales bacterium]